MHIFCVPVRCFSGEHNCLHGHSHFTFGCFDFIRRKHSGSRQEGAVSSSWYFQTRLWKSLLLRTLGFRETDHARVGFYIFKKRRSGRGVGQECGAESCDLCTCSWRGRCTQKRKIRKGAHIKRSCCFLEDRRLLVFEFHVLVRLSQ
jgi:hypothetical protein